MYTQCPDCALAFKVTADVLKQAAGMVRCGGCSNAFNALSFLSETMPRQVNVSNSDTFVPELTPEIPDTDDGEPMVISAEQSAALLKTLDELAGSDIRIEDTGVEWRVLDDAEASQMAADDDVFDAIVDDLAEVLDSDLTIDEPLEASETPVDEFLTSTPEIVEAPEIFDEFANGPGKTSVEELRFDDNTPLPDDFDLDDESSYVPQPVAEQPAAKPSIEPQIDPQIVFDLSEPDEWADLIDEFEDVAAELDKDAELVAESDADLADDAQEDVVDEVVEEVIDDIVDDVELDFDEESIDTELVIAEELATAIDGAEIDNLVSEDEPTIVDELDLLDNDDSEERVATDDDIEPELKFELIDEPQEVALTEAPATSTTDYHVPPMTEEEHTVNMQIDEDLMALAMPDEDGFASTIVVAQKEAEEAIQKKLEESGTAPQLEETESQDIDVDTQGDLDLEPAPIPGGGLETIIMEGATVHSLNASQKVVVDKEESRRITESVRAQEAADAAQDGEKRYGMIGGAVLLGLLLLFQVMHQSREALAKIPAFNNTVGQVYRAVGKPVQPNWDVTGWRFEATKGDAEDSDGLTVYSRLGNNSSQAMPYPLIGISLTDRFEETIGSRILDPSEYLAANIDPRELVEPGSNFDAVINIESAAEEAAGFKLNVCYRLSDGQLRCAIDDFK